MAECLAHPAQITCREKWPLSGDQRAGPWAAAAQEASLDRGLQERACAGQPGHDIGSAVSISTGAGGEQQLR